MGPLCSRKKSSSKTRSVSRSHGQKSIDNQMISKQLSTKNNNTNSRQQQLNDGKHSHKVVQRPQTQIALSRHNEYNNNDEDYSKQKKDELLQSIFKQRKDKPSTKGGSPHKDTALSTLTSKTFDGLKVPQHHHNLSQQQPVDNSQHSIINNNLHDRIVTPQPTQSAKNSQKQSIQQKLMPQAKNKSRDNAANTIVHGIQNLTQQYQQIHTL